MPRYIFIVGGVMSGIGKGVSTAAIAYVLKSRGYSVTCVKIDPYLNVDAGTMNPVEHGEVFVTDDGLECDQDIGNYERFLDENMYRYNYMTNGQVYSSVIDKERNLGYGGKCVEIIPHIPEEVIERVKRAGRARKADFVLVEIGGTVGEYQNMIFLEAGRMMKLRQPKKVLFIMVSYLPVPRMIGEMKTKPTQHAVRTLNAAGIQPDIIIARSVSVLDRPRRKKIGIFCNVSEDDVIPAPDARSIYEIPLNFERAKLDTRILRKFGIKPRAGDMKRWKSFVKKVDTVKKEKIKKTGLDKEKVSMVRVGVVGKYFATGKFTLSDSYISVIEAIKHAAAYCGVKPEITWIDSQDIERNPSVIKNLNDLDCLIVPGGFGERGVEGKIKTIKHARIQEIPFLGLCYGMQLAIVEFARNIAGLKNAHTTEINSKTKHPVISTLPEQEKNIIDNNFGGSMRLGAYPCELSSGTLVHRIYGEKNVVERHRHRYEFNNGYKESMENFGMIFSGINPQRNLVEIIELEKHPFFVGVQFHPEFKSRPLGPHPLFCALLRAAKKRKATRPR